MERLDRQLTARMQVNGTVCPAAMSVEGELELFSPRHQGIGKSGKDTETAEADRRAPASVIAEGTIISGNVISQDDIRVDGSVHGEVRGKHVWIGFEASVEGVVVAERVTVDGDMRGPVFAGHIHLGAASRVEGDLCTDNITIDKGAILVGRVWPGQPPSRADARQERLSGAFTSPATSSVSNLSTLAPVAIEKSPPADPGGPKDP